MSATDELIENAERYARAFDKGDLAAPPARKVIVLTCMDARIDPIRLLGLELGDAHVIRNAGGVVTDDAIRSIAISQHLLGTEEIVLIHHTGCGLLTVTDDALAATFADEAHAEPRLRAPLGRRPGPLRDALHQRAPQRRDLRSGEQGADAERRAERERRAAHHQVVPVAEARAVALERARRAQDDLRIDRRHRHDPAELGLAVRRAALALDGAGAVARLGGAALASSLHVLA